MSRMPEPRTVNLLDRPPLKGGISPDILAGLPAAPAPAKPEPTKPKADAKPKAAAPAAPKPAKRRGGAHHGEHLAQIAAHQFVIEDNVPLPVGRTAGSLAERMPFAKLEVGQSFVIPTVSTSTAGSWVTRWQKKLPGRQFVRAREGDGMRIWRIK